MDIKALLKEMVNEYFVIITGTVIGTLVYCMIFSRDSVFTVHYFMQILIFGVCGDLPLLVFYSRKELKRTQLMRRWVYHFCLLEAVLLFLGYRMDMYQTPLQGVFFAFLVLGVYLLVLFFSVKRDQAIADDMNENLMKMKK